MFDQLRHAFKEALDNFQKELDRDQVPENVDKLLKGMIDEAADSKVRLKELEEEVARASREASVEKKQAEIALRRGEMAEKINDAETVAIAKKFAEKHVRRQLVLEQKGQALREEVEIRTAEIAEMMRSIKKARAQRESLAATSGRTGARESLGAADDLFSELDRMADRIDGQEAAADAAREIDDLDLGSSDDGLHVDFDEPARPAEIDVDSRLEELKRRMGRD